MSDDNFDRVVIFKTDAQLAAEASQSALTTEFRARYGPGWDLDIYRRLSAEDRARADAAQDRVDREREAAIAPGRAAVLEARRQLGDGCPELRAFLERRA